MMKPLRDYPCGCGGGYISVTVLFALIFLMVIAAGAALLVENAFKPVASLREETDWFALRNEAVGVLIEAFAEDDTPEADGPDDPFVELNGTTATGLTLTIRDASSRFPLQWTNPDIIAPALWQRILLPGKTTIALKDHRETVGYGMDLHERYQDFFVAEDIDTYFTVYGWANVNTASEETLADLYRFRVERPGADSDFLAKIRQKRQSLGLWTEAEMESLLGTDKDRTYPLLNALPSMNVNFAPEPVLEAVLSYPFPDGALSPAVTRAVVDARKTRELKPQDLTLLIPVRNQQQQRVFAFLGTRTWFWEVTVEGFGRSEILVFASVPDPGASTPREQKGELRLVRIAGVEEPVVPQ